MPQDKKTKSNKEQFATLHKQIQQICTGAALKRYEKHYHPRNAHHRKHLYTDAVLAALVFVLVALSAYIFVFYRSAVLREQIDFNIIPGMTTVVSGGELEAEINIKNNSGQALSNAYLQFPIGTEYVISNAGDYNLERNVIQLGTLDDGEDADITISGYVISGIDKSVRISSVLHYQGGGLIRGDQKMTSEIVDVFGSSLTVQLNIPETIAANQQFDFSINYHNESSATNFMQVGIYPTWPPGFEVIESDPELADESDFWMIESIGSLEQGEITGKARLRAQDLEIADIELKIFASPFGTPYLQEQLSLQIPVHYPNVDVSAISRPGVVNLGQQVNYVIQVKNKESFELKNVKARLTVNQAIFAIGAGEFNEDGLLEIDLADTLAAGATADITHTLSIRQQINPAIAFGAGDVSVSLPVEFVYYDNNDQLVSIPHDPILTALNSKLSVDAFARYYSAEGDQIGRGPVSPIIGETTKYWVFLHLTNQLHQLRDTTVTAELPLGVEWTGRVSVTDGSSITFNPGTRLIHWPVGQLADFKTDFDQSGYGAAFELSVTPGVSQVGENITLLKNIEAEGVDETTGHLVSEKIGSIINDLLRDTYAGYDGKVSL